MSEQDSTLESVAPRREWLVRCVDKTYELGVCSVEANDGFVEIISPNHDITTLQGPEIIDFRDALNAAIWQAAVDVHSNDESTRFAVEAGKRCVAEATKDDQW